MGTHVIAGDSAICEDAKENVNRVVGEGAAIVRENSRLSSTVRLSRKDRCARCPKDLSKARSHH